MMAVRWDRKIVVANVGSGVLTSKVPGSVYCSPILYILAIGRPVSKGAGFGTTPLWMRRKASWRGSTPERVVMAGPRVDVFSLSCCWRPMTLPDLVHVRTLATARNESKSVARMVSLHGGTTGPEFRRITAAVMATQNSYCCSLCQAAEFGSGVGREHIAAIFRS